MTAGETASWIADPTDERLHEPTGDASLPWKETWYISLHDADSDQTLNVHATVSANRSPSTRVGVSLASGGRTATAVLRDDGDNGSDAVGNDLCRIQFQHLSSDSAHELRLRGVADGAEFDVTVMGRHHLVLWDTMFAGFYPTGKAGHQYSHAEQLVTGEGTVRWPGEEPTSFAGTGWRDRGWGRRKSEQTFNTSMDLVGAILPDGAAFSMMSMRNIEAEADTPMPVAGWRSDGETLAHLVGGTYHKDAMCWPALLDLEFDDGSRLRAHTVARAGSVPCAWHDAEPEGAGFAVGLRDFYALMEDAEGRHFTCFSNYGAPHKVDVLRDTRIFRLES